MNSSIFVVDTDNQLSEFRRSQYGSEDLLQKLLADHPSMLAGAAGPKGKLILVSREHPVPDQAEGAERWSLDHLFLDADGVPVLVEVKRASDTRARREVVAQMLDYAANGVAYWPVDRLVSAYKQTALSAGRDPDETLSEFLSGGEAEGFWRQVDANLRSGRIRMLFVADRISRELTRIVEFINEQMRPAEVLAIEVENFVGADGVRTLVPRLVGATARAQTVKSVEVPLEPVEEDEWLRSLTIRFGQQAQHGAERAIHWLREKNIAVEPTRSQDAFAAEMLRANGKPTWSIFIRKSTGRLELSLANLVSVPAYMTDESRKALLDRIKAIPTNTLRATDKLNGWPSVSLEALLKEDVWAAFQSIASDVKIAVGSQ